MLHLYFMLNIVKLMKPPKLDYHGLMDDQHINSKNMIFYDNILKLMIQIQSNLKYI